MNRNESRTLGLELHVLVEKTVTVLELHLVSVCDRHTWLINCSHVCQGNYFYFFSLLQSIIKLRHCGLSIITTIITTTMYPLISFIAMIAITYIKVITKLPKSEQSYKGKVKTHKYINRQNQSTTGKLWKP